MPNLLIGMYEESDILSYF